MAKCAPVLARHHCLPFAALLDRSLTRPPIAASPIDASNKFNSYAATSSAMFGSAVVWKDDEVLLHASADCSVSAALSDAFPSHPSGIPSAVMALAYLVGSWKLGAAITAGDLRHLADSMDTADTLHRNTFVSMLMSQATCDVLNKHLGAREPGTQPWFACT